MFLMFTGRLYYGLAGYHINTDDTNATSDVALKPVQSDCR